MDAAPLPLDLTRRPFRTSEAVARGVPLKRLRAQDLWTPTRGVRAVDLPTTIVEQARAFAAAAPTEFAFSHVTAAQLLGIPLPYAVEAECLVHIVTPTSANRIRRAEVQGHRGLESREVVEVHGLPVVAPADTWADLGEYVGPGKPVGLDDLIVAGDAVVNLVGGRGAASPRGRASRRTARQGDAHLRDPPDAGRFVVSDGDPSSAHGGASGTPGAVAERRRRQSLRRLAGVRGSRLARAADVVAEFQGRRVPHALAGPPSRRCPA